MKKIAKLFCILMCFIILGTSNVVDAASTQSSRPAAPYTKEASEKLTKLINEYGLPETPVKQKITSSDMLETYIKSYIKIWGMAGYDFRKSIDKYVHDMNVNPTALGLPPLYEYTIPQVLGYTAISTFYQGNEDELVLKKYFSQETINNFNKNISKKSSNNSNTLNSQTSKYWFPQGVNPNMLTDTQIRSYEIVDIDTYRRSANYAFSNSSAFVGAKVNKAKEQGRPLIAKDLENANQDYVILKKINFSLNDSISQSAQGEQYGTLNESQEYELNRIINEYGTSVLDDGLKMKLERYRQRQSYMRNNKPTVGYDQSQSNTTEQTKAYDRYDVHRFYDGFEYQPTTSSIKKNIVPKVIDTLTNSVYGLINY